MSVRSRSWRWRYLRRYRRAYSWPINAWSLSRLVQVTSVQLSWASEWVDIYSALSLRTPNVLDAQYTLVLREQVGLCFEQLPESLLLVGSRSDQFSSCALNTALIRVHSRRAELNWTPNSVQFSSSSAAVNLPQLEPTLRRQRRIHGMWEGGLLWAPGDRSSHSGLAAKPQRFGIPHKLVTCKFYCS